MNELNLDKLKMQTPNKTNENIENILKLFPNVSTEIDGKKAIDFDLLRQMLSDEIVEGDEERYRLDWPGKKASLLKANISINKTLRPCKDDSVDFENTQNLYIEGDNFEVLKILSESYLNKIKMIYIDPPYNTGKDFVYKDNFTKSKDEFEDDINLRDEEGNKLFKNTDTNGRFHSDWLSMMYERLLLSRDLLKDDGVIFISIDDNEVHNLRKICDEIFGERNFVASVIWDRKRGRDNSAKWFSKSHEYLLIYAKNINLFTTNFLELDENTKKAYKNPDNDSRGNYRMLATWARGTQGGVKYDFTNKDGKYFSERLWLFSKNNLEKMDNENRLLFKGDNIYRKLFINENKGKIPETIWTHTSNAANASDEIKSLFKEIIFDTSKPIPYISEIMKIGISKNDLILDFFSGSATTAHAVMDLNAQDGGNRKFIMVQLPELADEKSEAYKAGYKTIAEIGEERIRRAGKKIKEDNKTKEGIENLDIGFRVLKTDTTNFKDVYYHPNQLGQGTLVNLESNIKEDRSDLDLLFATMIDLGIELSLKITSQKIDNITIYSIENSELIACFENNISQAVIEEIIKQKPYQVVFKDGCFNNDNVKINTIQKLSTITTVSVI
ncbi:MAG: site-specific DNA-methyltransferase [Arcobacter sp.]|nr:site-specific DNA-methyltransferase [Arcobacter sp.]|tara:strand:- start:2693 stop:4531 length:1839 start_codon:yes stop_codon:yes gene_type:complete